MFLLLPHAEGVISAARNFRGAAERLQRASRKKKRADSPEENRLSLPDCDIVHHSVVRLRLSLAADGQPCRHKKQNPQTEQKCAFGKGDKVSA